MLPILLLVVVVVGVVGPRRLPPVNADELFLNALLLPSIRGHDASSLVVVTELDRVFGV